MRWQGSDALVLLGPTVLGFALGLGRGVMLSKLVLPHSRLPARLASTAVMVGIPLVLAFSSLVAQTFSDVVLIFALLALNAAVAAWLPLGWVRLTCTPCLAEYFDARLLHRPAAIP